MYSIERITMLGYGLGIQGVYKASYVYRPSYQYKLMDFYIITRPVPGRVQGVRCRRASHGKAIIEIYKN